MNIKNSFSVPLKLNDDELCLLTGEDSEIVIGLINKLKRHYKQAHGEVSPLNTLVSKPPTHAEAMEKLEGLWNRLEQGEVKVTEVSEMNSNYGKKGLEIIYHELK